MAVERMKDIKFEEGYRISIEFQNGGKITYDMQPRIITARFRDLADWRVFSSGKIVHSGKIIRWNDNTEMSLEEILFQTEDAGNKNTGI